MERRPENIELSPESEFAKHALMIRLGLQKSVEDGFLSSEKAREWYWSWVDANHREDYEIQLEELEPPR